MDTPVQPQSQLRVEPTQTSQVEPSRPAREVLQNLDLLRVIFEHFDVDVDEDRPAPGKKSLLSVALSCKAFVDPALDILWRNMHSLTPFFNLFPAYKILHGMTVPMLHGPILDADWIRFESYAHRLRRLKVEGNSADVISSSTLHRLGRSLRPLFPQLRHISFPSSSVLSTAFFLLSSASLQHLEVRGISEESDILVTLLYILTSDAPNLRSLSLDGQAATQLSLQPVKQFMNLRSLSVTQMGRLIDDTFLAWISSLTQLTHLTVDLQSSPLSSIPGGFSTLLSLNIAGSSSLVLLFLTAVKSATLEDLSLRVLTGGSGSATPAEWKFLVDATKSKWLTSLRGFTLKDNRALESVLSLTDVFGALCQLKGLERFEVKQHQSRSTLTDADCRYIAESWRMLRVLHIEVPLQAGGPSIEALIDFAKNCPHLKSLSLYVNFDGVQSHSSQRPTSSHGLELLSFGRSAEGDKLAIAKCLDNLFPRLKRLGGMVPNSNESRSWEQVKNFIWAFKDVRAEERARVAISDG